MNSNRSLTAAGRAPKHTTPSSYQEAEALLRTLVPAVDAPSSSNDSDGGSKMQSRHKKRGSDIEWAMPTGTSPAKEALTWQQTSAAPAPRKERHHEKRASTAVMPQVDSQRRGPERVSTPTARTQQQPKAPDSALATSLTWQQELLQAGNSQQRFKSPAKPNGSPEKARRTALKDRETFGLDASLGELSIDGDHAPFEMDDVFGARSNKRNNGQRSAAPATPDQRANTKRGRANSLGDAQNSSVAAVPNGVRYAGPTFHNSPEPTSLPAPSFLSRRGGPPPVNPPQFA